MTNTDATIRSIEDILAHDALVDQAICGMTLAGPEETRFKEQGAHDSTPTPYFVLDELFGHFAFDERSHLLDVGCGTGRVLAQFLRLGCPGRATGIELDPALAAKARAWSGGHGSIRVLQGDVREQDLGKYTDFYLFNPFDSGVLMQFIYAVEQQVKHPCTVIHMSDNGETWLFTGRDGWTELASGEFKHYRNARGYPVKFYDHPQHYTVWHHDPV